MQQTAEIKLVNRAWQAGRSVGTAAQAAAWSRLLLAEDLADDVRERLGYAMHAVMQAKQTGRSAAELWARLQTSFGAAQGKPLALTDIDDTQLGLLAFTAGACQDDRAVGRDIQQYVRQIVRGRLFVAS
jgi:hypothetical protein